MSHFLDKLTYFKLPSVKYAKGHGMMTSEDRTWEDAYRARWQHDKIVRSTHGNNCTGSCSWQIFVKGGIIVWELQQTNYPRTRDDLPNHEPRGCARGASYSWYVYSANRVKYPMVRARLLKSWREAVQQHQDPVLAWQSIVENETKRKEYQQQRGLGGFVRVNWDEVNQIVVSSHIYTIKKYGPDRVIGFSPIPAMSMISYAAGARYLSLIGGVCLSFYDWYCDLPPASPQTWGEQTDVPESADWYNSNFIISWGSNIPQTRTPDAHFFTEVRYKGAKVVAVTPDYAEISKLCDIWMHPQQGTDSALAMAMGHVILKEWYVDKQSDYFIDYVRRYTDMPVLVMLKEKELQDGTKVLVHHRYFKAADFVDNLGEDNNPEWKTLAFDQEGNVVVPNGSIGFRWGSDERNDKGKWNLEAKQANGDEVQLQLSLLNNEQINNEVVAVAYPYFGGIETPAFTENKVANEIILRHVPATKVKLADGSEVYAATVFDLLLAQYGVGRGIVGENAAQSFEDNTPYTPTWQEIITGVPSEQCIAVARQFAETAHKTHGKSMIILGASTNHWYHADMTYRGIINMLMMCGCIGQSGGGWAHYVGQEKLRPQTGWTLLAFGLDWVRPPRHMNSTSFFYAHTDQWRYEQVGSEEIISPLAINPEKYSSLMIDQNIRAERMGWLPSAPQLQTNPMTVAQQAKNANMDVVDFVTQQLKQGSLKMSCEDPDHPNNWPRSMMVWRSNLLGSSAKGHEYFLKHFLGTVNGVQGKDLGEQGMVAPEEVVWHEKAPEGKLDLLTTIDFRMCTTCIYSDVVLPAATWYEKNDLNTSDMHPFIHPLSQAIEPAWDARSDWAIYRGFAETFSQLCVGHLGVETDTVLLPLQHDTPDELAQPFVLDWKKGECDLVPGKTAPHVKSVVRDYPNTYQRFTSLGPLPDKLGNGGKGIAWNTQEEVKNIGSLNGVVLEEGVNKGRPKIFSDIDAAETVLMFAPETNGQVAVKAWAALSKITGRDHTHLAIYREDEKIRYRDIQAQPRKIISSPTWSGLESEHVSYNAGYTNVHELIPWRTVTGREQFYQDHPWMLDFGVAFAAYRPPINLKTTEPMLGRKPNGNPEITLNFITPHQKWGIHSTYSDNLFMLTLNRGGPVVWLSEDDAKKAQIEDNDWVELFNINGAIAARAVVSQRVNPGMIMMYHAQEKMINVPGSEITHTRGGIHNSVTRISVNPTHMIGGYAQYSYGFNYYGTIGTNRDEFVVVRRMRKVDWLDEPAGTDVTVPAAVMSVAKRI